MKAIVIIAIASVMASASCETALQEVDKHIANVLEWGHSYTLVDSSMRKAKWECNDIVDRRAYRSKEDLIRLMKDSRW